MTEKYEQTGKTTVEHAKTERLRGLVSRFEIAIPKDTYDELLSFIRSRGMLSMSFEISLEGYTELFCIYRFVNEDKTRTNTFIHTDQFGYEELINMSLMSGNDNHINVITTGDHAYSFYPVDDIEKYKKQYLIGHIINRMIKLNNILEDQEDKEIMELVYDYMKMIYEKYK